MLAKQYRLKKNKEFDLVFQKGKYIGGSLFFLLFKENKLSDNRFGFVIGKKISKKATVRNKIRRRISEIIRTIMDNIKPGFDIVVGAKTEVIGKDYREIKENLEELFRKAKLIK